MSPGALLPLAAVLSALGPGIVIAFLPETRHGLRTVLNLAGALLQVGVVTLLVAEAARGNAYTVRIPFVVGTEILLQTDPLALLLAGLSAALWLLTTIYAIGYLEGSPHRSRFFSFFSLCVSATLGLALAGNLFTFFVFYELLTLATYPLVVHRGTDESVRAGRVYLGYTLAGGLALLVGMAWLTQIAGPVEFEPGGVLTEGAADPATLAVIFALLVGGMGVKAGLVPLHGWLPVAMIAPAPVSALLHAVAVVKAGAFGIVRVVDEVYGIALVTSLGLATPLALLATVTILYGSLRALAQDYLKRRLAYSTISQVAYITLGVALGGATATMGGLMHLVHQGIMKITLFFCAGALAETLGVHRISEMAGVGRRMPGTMAAFTVGALGMIGAPPTAGFITKWYLGLGGLGVEKPWVVGVLALSGLLNAAYFLPVLYVAWFKPPEREWPASGRRLEAHWMLLAPPLVTAVLALLLGLLASTPFSALQWARLISFREVAP
ncbi:NADH dehydrogenase [Thiohalorhabdus denitrificans]|uniref:Multicomponent Na+:H+ antiporter subunit D n=1 Tax=Thiohalorhabdus denitrificans TaxID=381306 RepID=A0A0P9ERG7_9GAMM|nr:proton-conducting transporter membrane subunit [Thiohalorhabdus denitrificans]KPV41087.1 NADH dehydrogenase [Thiohalorhabdus denitrificans]SCY38988.1 multicomponent Na+:H+ antiporter subunit D [Thiohalorhabdus denitrificans]